MLGVLNKVFDPNKRDLKRLEKTADRVEALASEFAALSDDALKAKTEEFIARHAKGESLMTCCLKHSRLFVKRRNVYLACTHSVYRSWGLFLFMKGIFLR